MHLLQLAGAVAGLASQATALVEPPQLYRGPQMGLNLVKGTPDKAPSNGDREWTSPLVLPSPNTSGYGEWSTAVKKARNYVSKLTLDEKINMTTGIGTLGRCGGNTGEITRLKFPGICLHDGPLGLRNTDENSAFPAGVNAAATWDPSLMRRRGEAMGAEFRGKGVNIALGPMMNLARAPAGGRNWEGYGEDPYLSGVGAAQTVAGIQSQGVIACSKHYVGNEQEHYRGTSGGLSIASSSNIDDRTMHEVYTWPFAETIHAGVGSIMCSYQRLNQTFACENSKAINGIAKGELNFQGIMLSDWAAISRGVEAALAGADMNMPGFISYPGPSDPDPNNSTNSYWGSRLRAAVLNGSVPMWRLDDMVTRTFAAYFKMGQDKGYPAVNFNGSTAPDSGPLAPGNEHVDVQGDHAKLIREIGAASTVLLKNVDNTLPLVAKNIEQLMLVGDDAGPNENGPNSCSDRGCNNGTLAEGWGSGTANYPFLIDPHAAIQHYMHENAPLTEVAGILEDYNYDEVIKVGKLSDTCIVFVTADSGEEFIHVDGNAGDRNNLRLWHKGDKLIKTTTSVCDNTIVVIHTVGAVNMEAWVENPNVKAVVLAGLPGEESGNSLVDVLFGDVNPSGRLPYTIAKRRGDYAADVLYESDAQIPQITYSEKLNIGYRHFDAQGIEPRFAFGHGLSYTTFKYSALSINKVINREAERDLEAGIPELDARGGAWDDDFPVLESRAPDTPPGGPAELYETVFEVTFTIANTGKVYGHEVPQLYLGFPASANEPPRVLRGFTRVAVQPGKNVKVTLPLRRKDFSIWNTVSQSWTIPSGQITAYVGASSRDIRLQGKFKGA